MQNKFYFQACFNVHFGASRFAEMDLEKKNEISHRGKALKALKEFLEELHIPTVKKLKKNEINDELL